MTTDPTRAAKIVVEQRHRDAAKPFLWKWFCDHAGSKSVAMDQIDRGLFDHTDLVQAFARLERDHTQRPTDTARAGKHPSHKTRFSDASSYDEVCTQCGATDIAGGGWGKLAEPCPTPSPVTDEAALSGEVLGYSRMASHGRCDFEQLREALAEATTGDRGLTDNWPDDIYPGHVSVQGINYNSLNRIVTAFVDAALASTPQPAETVSEPVPSDPDEARGWRANKNGITKSECRFKGERLERWNVGYEARRAWVRAGKPTNNPTPQPVAAETVERAKYIEALARIAETDWHTRNVKPNPNGGIRGQAGMIAAFALTGRNGSFIGDKETRAAADELLTAIRQSAKVGE